jgi:hypothetical protein
MGCRLLLHCPNQGERHRWELCSVFLCYQSNKNFCDLTLFNLEEFTHCGLNIFLSWNERVIRLLGDLLNYLAKQRILWFPYILAFIIIAGTAFYALSQPDWKNILEHPVILVIGVVFLIFPAVLLYSAYRQHKRSLSIEQGFSDSGKEIVENTYAIEIMNKIAKTIAVCLWEPFSEENNRDTFIHICQLIQAFMTNEKSQSPKVAIFVPNEDETHLVPCGWANHSLRIKKLALKISQESSAGFTYMTGEVNYEPDVTAPGARFEPNKHADSKYFSLVTVPIKCGNEVIGVLSVTGVEKDSYNADEDFPYLKAFANALSPLVAYHITRRKGVHDERLQGAGARKENV